MCVALLTTNVQLLISKNQQQILHGYIQIVQRGKIDTLSTYMHNVRPVLCEGRYCIHMWKALAKLHLFSLKGEVFVLKTSSIPPLFFKSVYAQPGK
jgi:hypothetical protein